MSRRSWQRTKQSIKRTGRARVLRLTAGKTGCCGVGKLKVLWSTIKLAMDGASRYCIVDQENGKKSLGAYSVGTRKRVNN